jgi:glycosyltransferase involved in cell wall biosynthesis
MLSRKYKNLKVIGETDKVESYLRDSDVFFLLSRNEGQPLSILEAMRAGLLILSTDVGCNSSMIKGDSGILVKPLKDEILQAFDRIVINWDSIKDNGHLSRELFRKKFTEEIMYNSYLKLFNSIA